MATRTNRGNRTTRKTAAQKREQLQALARKNRTGIYDMLRIACELLDDPTYVAEYGGEAALIDDLQAREFAHFGRSPSLQQMIYAYRENPQRSIWNEYDYNIWAMIDLANPKAKSEQKTRINWKQRAKEAEARVEQLEATVNEYQASCHELKSRVDKLLAENGQLRGEIKQLEKRVMVNS